MRSLLLLLPVLWLCACAVHRPVYTQTEAAAPYTQPRYDDLRYWAAHPAKHDPADSVPAPLRGEPRDTVADVFFIHPTTFTAQGGSGNADPADAALNQKTDASTILFQASVFNQHARVFAPRYRQAHLSSFYTDPQAAAPYFDTAYADVQAAFAAFLTWSGDRPIIIAAHSQGAKMANRLLSEFFDGTPLQQRLVAAYIVGWPVPQQQFRQLPVCSSPGQTGCFVSWRTFREGYVPEYIQREEPPALVTNPLHWRTDTTAAPATLNAGSVLRNFNKVIPHTTDARVAGGVLWVRRPRFPGAFLIKTPNYHIGDINLFYVNIRQNVAARIRTFQQQQQVRP